MNTEFTKTSERFNRRKIFSLNKLIFTFIVFIGIIKCFILLSSRSTQGFMFYSDDPDFLFYI